MPSHGNSDWSLEKLATKTYHIVDDTNGAILDSHVILQHQDDTWPIERLKVSAARVVEINVTGGDDNDSLSVMSSLAR